MLEQPTPFSTAESDRLAAIRAEQFRVVYKEVPFVTVGTAVGGVLLVLGLSNVQPPHLYLGWLFGLFLAHLPTVLVYLRYKRAAYELGSPPSDPKWKWGLVLPATASGSAWGLAAVLMFPEEPAYQAALIIAMLLVALSGVGSASAHLGAAWGFLTAVMVPLAVRTAAEGELVYLMLAAGIALLFGLLLFYAQHLNRLIRGSIAMRFDNLQLSEALTEQKVRERTRILEAANRHKSEFLANMSHELRTPLNSIIGFSEVLKDRMIGELNAKQQQYAELIHSSGHHLLALINEILDLTKVEAGRMELAVSSFDVRTSLEHAVTLVAERAHKHQLQICLKVGEGVESIAADERKVRQIVLNLLSNAIKFTPSGGRIDVRADCTSEGLEVSVSDTGVGISEQDQERIFVEFEQVSSDYTRKREGTGLGLTLCKKFVELHGGKISVRSAPGKGAVFTFVLPARPCPAS
jgi:signal transduction histidine kinase